MKLINPKVEIIPQERELLGVYKQIEKAGRTCYKSEDRITEDSAEKFVKKMTDLGHTAMLEHGTVYLCIPVEDWDRDAHEWEYMFPEGLPWVSKNCDGRFHLITTNFRHIVEGGIGIETMSKYLCQPVKGHEKRVSVRFTCDRGVSHELVRHRVFSFAQESTRYCNYSKDKFGNELTFILPTWYNNANPLTQSAFRGVIDDCEKSYLWLLSQGYTPQQARQVLPNALKTEVVMTGFASDWKHFFELRCAPNAHPDMQLLANQLKEMFLNNNLL